MSSTPSHEPLPEDLVWLDRLLRVHCATGDLDARRIFHGRGAARRSLAWLTVDAFAGWFYFVFHARPPEQMESWLHALAQFCEPLGYRLACQYRFADGAPSQGVGGCELPERLWIKEADLSFQLRFASQNCGLFFDAQTARTWVKDHAQDKAVLNLFAYTCGYSVAAKAGGARFCLNVDKNRTALAWGRENHRANDGDSNVRYLGCDILKSWSRIRKFAPFDLIVVDPPSYQKGSFIAKQDYVKVLRRLPSLCAEEADILLALNAPELPTDFLEELVKMSDCGLQFKYRLDLPAAFTAEDRLPATKFAVFGRCLQTGPVDRRSAD